MFYVHCGMVKYRNSHTSAAMFVMLSCSINKPRNKASFNVHRDENLLLLGRLQLILQSPCSVYVCVCVCVCVYVCV